MRHVGRDGPPDRTRDSSIAVKRCQRRSRSSLAGERLAARRAEQDAAVRRIVHEATLPYNGRAMTARPPLVLDYGAFQQPPSPLFRDYLAGAPAGRARSTTAAPLGPRRAARLRRPGRPLARPRRGGRRGARPPAGGSAAAAAAAEGAAARGRRSGRDRHRPAARCSSAGPLYVLYKAAGRGQGGGAPAGAARAGRWSRSSGSASDDHDFAEVRSVTVLDEAGPDPHPALRARPEPVGPARLAHRPRRHDHGAWSRSWRARCPPGSTATRCSAAGRAVLPPGRHAGRRLRAPPLRRSFPELVVLDPSDPALKTPMAPVLSRELPRGLAHLAARARSAASALLAAGYHQQVPVRTGLPEPLRGDGRRAARAGHPRTARSRCAGSAARSRVAEARAHAGGRSRGLEPRRAAAAAGPGPLLPTAAYVGGPAEIAYHAQIGPSYAHFGIPRPVARARGPA